MELRKNDVLGGVRSLLNEQKALPGKLTVSMSMFDSEYTVLARMRPVQEEFDLSSYPPRGSTALFDSLHRLMAETGRDLAALPENERPGKVLVIVFTDGEENSSQEITAVNLRESVQHQKSQYNWEFLFIGADFDVWAQGAALGMRSVGVRGQNLGGAGMAYTSAYIGSVRAHDGLAVASLESARSVEDAEAAVASWKAKISVTTGGSTDGEST